MSIYTSEKVLPYVYMCVHRISGQIYYGSRTTKALKYPSHIDLPKYKTSSKYVKPIFEEFDWHIVAEFFDGIDAHNFEQELIYFQWQIDKSISLNKSCHHNSQAKFNTTGVCGYKRTFSEEHKLNISIAKKNQPPKPKGIVKLTPEHCKAISDGKKGKPAPNKGKNMSKEQHAKMTKLYSFVTPHGFVIYDISVKDICVQFNLSVGMIRRCIRDLKFVYKGFHILLN